MPLLGFASQLQVWIPPATAWVPAKKLPNDIHLRGSTVTVLRILELCQPFAIDRRSYEG